VAARAGFEPATL